jgi:hypothetical protein
MHKMKKEFMFYVRNDTDAKLALSEARHLEFVRNCEVYIKDLKEKGNLIAAQPLDRDGLIISRDSRGWINTPIGAFEKVHVGYYHIMANDINEAVELAQKNPEFDYVPSASIEIRKVKTKEEKTNFVYPAG